MSMSRQAAGRALMALAAAGWSVTSSLMTRHSVRCRRFSSKASFARRSLRRAASISRAPFSAKARRSLADAAGGPVMKTILFFNAILPLIFLIHR